MESCNAHFRVCHIVLLLRVPPSSGSLTRHTCVRLRYYEAHERHECLMQSASAALCAASVCCHITSQAMLRHTSRAVPMPFSLPLSLSLFLFLFLFSNCSQKKNRCKVRYSRPLSVAEEPAKGDAKLAAPLTKGCHLFRLLSFFMPHSMPSFAQFLSASTGRSMPAHPPLATPEVHAHIWFACCSGCRVVSETATLWYRPRGGLMGDGRDGQVRRKARKGFSAMVAAGPIWQYRHRVEPSV